MIALKPELVENLDTTQGIQAALQTAIELEHATIPPYLYAYWSLSDPNQTIQGLIRSVVIEEMGHLALACNVLNAIGGSPSIDNAAFVPQYPGPLPGGVEDQLVVPLAPFSIVLVENVFMVIEEPENPLVFPEALNADEVITIGRFYTAIRDAIAAAGESIFTGPSANQVTDIPSSVVIAVNDVATATTAINTIIDQGEGTTQAPDDLEGSLAHYYRFQEIVKGKQLVKDPTTGKFSFSGPAIEFDPAGVAPAVTNPKAANYPSGSPAAQANDAFNSDYATLLQTLHQGFNGQPKMVDQSVGQMFGLTNDAQKLMSTSVGDGATAGPSFEPFTQ
jgi:Ferritin-like